MPRRCNVQVEYQHVRANNGLAYGFKPIACTAFWPFGEWPPSTQQTQRRRCILPCCRCALGGSIGAPPKCGKAATRLGCAWAERRLACGGGVSLCTDFAFAERRVSIAMKGLEPALGKDVAGVVRDDDIGPCTGKGVHIFHDNGAFIDQACRDGGFDHAVLARYIVASDGKQ